MFHRRDPSSLDPARGRTPPTLGRREAHAERQEGERTGIRRKVRVPYPEVEPLNNLRVTSGHGSACEHGLVTQAGSEGGGRVLLAAPRGYCAGVERAVEAVERALDKHGAPVY